MPFLTVAETEDFWGKEKFSSFTNEEKRLMGIGVMVTRIEYTGNNWCACALNYPGHIATGKTASEAVQGFTDSMLRIQRSDRRRANKKPPR